MSTLLLLLIVVPLLAGLALVILPGWSAPAARGLALAVSGGALLGALVLALSFPADAAGALFQIHRPWLSVGPGPGIEFAIGLDGLSLSLVVLTALLVLSSLLTSWTLISERVAVYHGLILILEGALIGAFSSLDVVLFYVFFEATLAPSFFLIGLFGGPERRRASLIFVIYTLAGSLLTLLGVISLISVLYQHTNPHFLTFSFAGLTDQLSALSWKEWHDTDSWSSPQVWIFLLLLAGFAVKLPLFPFHTWLPLTYGQAPTPVTMLLAGVMSKLGAYGLIRLCLAMTPLGAEAMFPWTASLAVVGILYGAYVALAQTELKALVTYSSLSHMGFIALGLFALNATGIHGATVQMVNHGITTAALFACVSMLAQRYGTTSVLQLGGLWDKLPIWTFFLFIAALGSVALPGLNGFVGEFPILAGMFGASKLAGTLAALGMVMGAYYLIAMLKDVAFGPLREPQTLAAPVAGSAGSPPSGSFAAIPPLSRVEVTALAPLALLVVVLGVYPAPLLDRLRPQVKLVTESMTRAQTNRERLNAPPPTTPAPAGGGRFSGPGLPPVPPKGADGGGPAANDGSLRGMGGMFGGGGGGTPKGQGPGGPQRKGAGKAQGKGAGKAQAKPTNKSDSPANPAPSPDPGAPTSKSSTSPPGDASPKTEPGKAAGPGSNPPAQDSKQNGEGRSGS